LIWDSERGNEGNKVFDKVFDKVIDKVIDDVEQQARA
jgi:hypothetical protein